VVTCAPCNGHRWCCIELAIRTVSVSWHIEHWRCRSKDPIDVIRHLAAERLLLSQAACGIRTQSSVRGHLFFFGVNWWGPHVGGRKRISAKGGPHPTFKPRGGPGRQLVENVSAQPVRAVIERSRSQPGDLWQSRNSSGEAGPSRVIGLFVCFQSINISPNSRSPSAPSSSCYCCEVAGQRKPHCVAVGQKKSRGCCDRRSPWSHEIVLGHVAAVPTATSVRG